MATDHRQEAQSRIDSLVALLRQQPAAGGLAPMIEECEALSRAIAAFHMEGIRFRMYNVDRMLHRAPGLPAEAMGAFAEVRRALEAAGFHTRSHQAPV